MQGIVIFKGKYGATKQYAEWLGQEFGIPVLFYDNAANKEVFKSDFLIIGSSVYIGKLEIRHWIKQNLDHLRNKKIYFFLVSGTPPSETEKLETYLRSGIPEEIRQRMQVFFLPGRLDIKKLSWKDRFLLNMGARLTKDPKVKEGMLTPYNHVKKENLEEIIGAVKATTAKFASCSLSA
jgi:menaquinone-dependent protoporphyrinogen IX oxidase